MTFASAIRFAVPLLLAATLAGCVVPYDQDPYYGGNTYSSPYYSGSYYGGDAYPAYPPRRHRTHRRDGVGDGDFRRQRRAHERSGTVERHRGDRDGDFRHRRRGHGQSGMVERHRDGDRTERAAAERRARPAARRAQERSPAPRRYDEYRGSGETGAAFSQRVARAERQAERESMTMERILADGAVPEK